MLLIVQAHAAAAVLNFSESCTPEILTPYLDGVISKLLVLLQVCEDMFLIVSLYLFELSACFLLPGSRKPATSYW